MTVEVPENEPTELALGETWKWRRLDLRADYPASAWTLKYYLRNASARIDLTASAYDTDDYQIEETPAEQTAGAWTAGTYDWRAYVERGSGATLERYEIDRGKVVISADFTAAANLDSRSHARVVLDAIEAVLENRATMDQEEYSIAGRSLKRTPVKDLMAMRERYAAMVKAEENKEAVANGRAPKNRMRVKF